MVRVWLQGRCLEPDGLIALGAPAVPLIRAELDAGQPSAETRARLKAALDKIAPEPAQPDRPVPLLRKMHPYLTTRPAG